MKIKGWDIGLSENDRKKGHDEIIKNGLQIGPYRTAYEEIHPDAHGVVNVDDEGRKRLRRMMIGQARINRAVPTDLNSRGEKRTPRKEPHSSTKR